jgi:hypothetical protein
MAFLQLVPRIKSAAELEAIMLDVLPDLERQYGFAAAFIFATYASGVVHAVSVIDTPPPVKPDPSVAVEASNEVSEVVNA